MTTQQRADLEAAFPTLEFVENEPLSAHTTVGIGGPAELFVQVSDQSSFEALAEYVQKHSVPITLLGWGANTLISDHGIDGLVLKNAAQHIEIVPTEEASTLPEPIAIAATARWGESQSNSADPDPLASSAEYRTVFVGAGTALPACITRLATQDLVGLEWFARIPATIGGAVYNNIHGATHLFSDFVQAVSIVDESGEKKLLTPNELEFGYDTSRFHHTTEIILGAYVRLKVGNGAEAIKQARGWAEKKAHQPSRSLGCIFQNLTPEEQAAHQLPTASVGYLIDKVLGLKGLRIGDAAISEAHCAFIENTGQATASEYLAVIAKIMTTAAAELDLHLKPEIFFKGFTADELATLNTTRDNGDDAN